MRVRFYISLLVLLAGSFVLGASCAPLPAHPVYPTCGEQNQKPHKEWAHPNKDAPAVLTW